jgi:hypothetical protein
VADKELEAWYVERLRTLWPGFPPGPRSPSENPDCLVRGPDRVVGIEVTTFVLESKRGEQPIREQLSVRSRIVARARDIYREGGGPVLIVDIEFDDRERLTKRDVDVLAQAIAQRLLAHSFAEDESPGWYQEVPPPLPRGVAAISGGRYQFAESWDGGSGVLLRECDPGHVQQIIDKKADRYGAYRLRCDAAFLLIVFSSEHDPTIEMPASVLQHTYVSPFDATIALLDDIPQAIELTAQPPVP